MYIYNNNNYTKTTGNPNLEVQFYYYNIYSTTGQIEKEENILR